jgi:ketosteroid isomerase-like protein
MKLPCFAFTNTNANPEWRFHTTKTKNHLRMKTLYLLTFSIFLTPSCTNYSNKDELKKEIFNTEKAFEKMASEKGVAQAFYYYADENAVIHRENDTLIQGKENIKTYYKKIDAKNPTVKWTPDFVDVSDCGTLGYTYGKYVWKIKNSNGEVVEHKGIFHTVWKKQKDKNWKYVWD